ncbi:MAG TPA: type II toxin-antitoxin system Phd/YefM family antitoxin [Deltaproteobacteria bacterium]|nr:type II toxin-antitoxin system Phd/YefM family antitoxin [Deltaproteobacteria bacterium]HXK47175.1 type II toxin-antitoxin system Phd/YefM family antitoxin [Deltaproteobacteria bacterium]
MPGRCPIKTVSFTEFRRNASKLFSDVERGETILVIRHGKAIAEINPVSDQTKTPSWKKQGLRLSIQGAELSSTIIEEREREDVL